MEKFLLFHTRYKDVQIGYFEQENLIKLQTLDSIKVSKCLLSAIDNLFDEFSISIKDVSFLGAHLGPAPYTTLRVVLATLNGINFSLGTPLIGVNGLDAFLKYLDKNCSNIVLLNAFGHDLYYAISTYLSEEFVFGCKNYEILLEELAREIIGPINFFGNGSILYKEKINQIFGSRAIIFGLADSQLIKNFDTSIVPIQFLGYEAFEKWKNKEIAKELFPVYLK